MDICSLAVYSLITRYHYSLVKWIPIGVHMTLDVLAGLALMVAPAMLNYAVFLTDWQYALHFVLGLGVIGLVVFTGQKTQTGVLSDISPVFKTRTDIEEPRRDRMAF